MTIVVGLDVHREGVRRFLGQFDGEELEVALEATTGWRFVVEELKAAGVTPHLAEPAETRSRRGTKRRAKTDRLDARHLISHADVRAYLDHRGAQHSPIRRSHCCLCHNQLRAYRERRRSERSRG